MPSNDSVTVTAPVGSFDTGQLIKDFSNESKREQADIESDRQLSDKTYQDSLTAIKDLDNNIPFIPKPQLAGSSEDRDPTKIWSQSPLKEKGFDSGDYKKMAFATIGMVALGAVSAGGMGALAGLGGVMKGFLNGKDKNNERAMDKWKADADAVATHNQQLNDAYKQALDEKTQTWNQRLARVQLIASVNNDYLMQKIALDKSNGAGAMHLIEARARMAEVILRTSPHDASIKMYTDQFTKFNNAADKGDADIKSLQAEMVNIDKAVGGEGSVTMFSRKEAQDAYRAGLPALNALKDQDQKEINNLTMKVAGYRAMATKFQALEVDETSDNPDIANKFISNGAQIGDIGQINGQWYKYDEFGAHKISEKEAQDMQKNQAEASKAGAVANAAGEAGIQD